MIDFTCRADDGAVLVFEATARDVLIWEKAGRERNFAKLMSELPLADLYVIARISARRQGLFDGTQDEFEKTYDLIFEAGAEPDPTTPAP